MFGDLIVGIVGAVVAGWVTGLSVGEVGLIWTIVVAAVFAAISVLVRNLIRNRNEVHSSAFARQEHPRTPVA